MLTIRKSILSTVGAGVAASLLLISGMAEAQQRSNPAHGLELSASQAAQPGDCKTQYVQALGPQPATAQAIWSQTVANGLGNKWAIWVGAQNKSVIPVAGPNGTTQFRAMAQPCFYHPVP